MAIRQDQSIILSLITDNLTQRDSIRQYLLSKWANEAHSSKYRYSVETLKNGKSIYLERPGRLNKGCDFVIFIEDFMVFKNGNDKPPKHQHILNDLSNKRNNINNQQWKQLLNGIDSVFNCNPDSIYLGFCVGLPAIGHDYELILKILKWFFIEQDLTYWSGHGRQMLYNEILKL